MSGRSSSTRDSRPAAKRRTATSGRSASSRRLASSKRPARRSRSRRGRTRGHGFIRWYRVVPLVLVGIVVVACAILAATPTTLARRTLYPVSHAQDIQTSADRHGVDPLLVAAVIKCESGWDENAQSSAGALGLMQVMPQTSSELARMGLVDSGTYDPSNLLDPATNIEYGTAYLACLQKNLSSTDEVIAAYNAGMGKVEEWLAQPGELADNITYTETREYLRRVNEAYQGYRDSYPTGLVVEQ